MQTPTEALAASKPMVIPNEKEAYNKEEPIIEEEQAPTEALPNDEQVVSKWGKKSWQRKSWGSIKGSKEGSL